MTNLKDKLTDIVAIVMVVLGAVNAYLQANAGGINWWELGTAVLVAVIAYFTGKGKDGKTLKN